MRWFLAFPCLMLAGCCASVGWSWHSSYGSIGAGGSVHIVDGDTELMLGGLGRGRIGVAFVQGDQLYGADQLDRLGGRQREWLAFDGDMVDHPQLPRWRAALAELEAQPAPAPAAFARSAQGLPFETLVGRRARSVVGDDPARAGEVLDHAAGLALDDEDARALLLLALRGDPADERVARWLTLEVLYEDSDALREVAGWSGCGPRAARAVLRKLDEVSSSHRDDVVLAVSERLLAEPGAEAAVVLALDELYSSGRERVVRELFARPDLPPRWAIELLLRLDDLLYRSGRMAVLRQLIDGPHFVGDAQDAALVAARDLLSSDRREVAEAMRKDARLKPELAEAVDALER